MEAIPVSFLSTIFDKLEIPRVQDKLFDTNAVFCLQSLHPYLALLISVVFSANIKVCKNSGLTSDIFQSFSLNLLFCSFDKKLFC